jgi:hypothetical protein
MIRWRIRGAATLGAALAVAASALSGCTGEGSPDAGPSGPPAARFSVSSPAPAGPSASSQQDIYRASLENDKASLDRGVLAYSPLSSLKTGQASTFSATVTDTGTGPQTVTVSTYDGMTVARQDVPTGGIVSVQIVGCQDLSCRGQSPVRQAVLARGDHATWVWAITAGQPGTAQIILQADTYDQNSSTALASEVMTITSTVIPTGSFTFQRRKHDVAAVTSAGLSVLDKLGIAAGAILSIGTIVGWFLARRKKAAGRGDDIGDEPAGAESSGT